MSDPLIEQSDGSTPLTPEELEELVPSYIAIRSELNEAEQANISEAEEWAFRRKRKVLDRSFLSTLHKKMFVNVWGWAGKFRKTEKNIGMDPAQIEVQLQELIDNCKYWIDNNTYEPDEIATRFHHRLVYIHPYSNGNGRHSRLATDLLLISIGREPFSWGRESSVDTKETRAEYIAALRAACSTSITLAGERRLLWPVGLWYGSGR